jgi:hypothetical protein
MAALLLLLVLLLLLRVRAHTVGLVHSKVKLLVLKLVRLQVAGACPRIPAWHLPARSGGDARLLPQRCLLLPQRCLLLAQRCQRGLWQRGRRRRRRRGRAGHWRLAWPAARALDGLQRLRQQGRVCPARLQLRHGGCVPSVPMERSKRMCC